MSAAFLHSNSLTRYLTSFLAEFLRERCAEDDFINKLIPTERQTIVKVFLITVFPYNFDKCAPKYPPVKEPTSNKINIYEGTDPILLK